jgi:hypothetical protein
MLAYRRHLRSNAHLVEWRMALSQMLFCRVYVIGHDVGDSCSRAISSGSGSQVAVIVPLMASWTVSC